MMRDGSESAWSAAPDGPGLYWAVCVDGERVEMVFMSTAKRVGGFLCGLTPGEERAFVDTKHLPLSAVARWNRWRRIQLPTDVQTCNWEATRQALVAELRRVADSRQQSSLRVARDIHCAQLIRDVTSSWKGQLAAQSAHAPNPTPPGSTQDDAVPAATRRDEASGLGDPHLAAHDDLKLTARKLAEMLAHAHVSIRAAELQRLFASAPQMHADVVAELTRLRKEQEDHMAERKTTHDGLPPAPTVAPQDRDSAGCRPAGAGSCNEQRKSPLDAAQDAQELHTYLSRLRALSVHARIYTLGRLRNSQPTLYRRVLAYLGCLTLLKAVDLTADFKAHDPAALLATLANADHVYRHLENLIPDSSVPATAN